MMTPLSATSPSAAVLPVHFEGVPLVQADARSCGAAALVMLAASGDATLASWLAGSPLPPDGPIPPEVPTWAWGLELPLAVRFEVAQRHVRSALRARRGLPWPAPWGTHPAHAAELARYGDYRFLTRWVGPRPGRRSGLPEIGAAMDAGVPCLLYVGGGSHESLTRRLPRHVVLAVPPKGGAGINIYEPASATLHSLALADLVGERRRAAFGHWSRLRAVVIPDLTQPTAGMPAEQDHP
ncbi:MAG: hypothetical protein Q4P36_05545 [Bowdeniella nasicola]|nr:hypothetical protein [Bowdeniella nasicola]